MKHWALTLACVLVMSVAVATPARAQGEKILVMGDSLLAWHSSSGRSVGHNLAKMLRADVTNRPVSMARIFYNLPITGAAGLSIPKQYRGESGFDWVVLSGGGNDLWLGCGCHRCDRMNDRLISEKGNSGGIPSLVAKLRKSGARVVIVGYLHSPGFDTPIESCKDEGLLLDERLKRLARLDRGIFYVSNTDLVPSGDLSYHAADRIHPSLKASREIAERVARVIVNN